MSAPRIFITGAASGLGRSLAVQWAASGAWVCLADRDDPRGRDVARELQSKGLHAEYLHCDVTEETDFSAAADWLESNWGGVDIVVNNAGVAQMGKIDSTTIDDWRWIVDINILGIARSCRVFAPFLKRQGKGKIVNIASMAGLLHLPGAAAYNATKAAVVAISETLEFELAADGIDVACVCPAFFRTDLAKNMRASDAVSEATTKRLVERSRMGPDEVAKIIIAALERGERLILTHPQARRSWLMKRFLPYGVYLGIIRGQLRKLEARLSRPSRGVS